MALPPPPVKTDAPDRTPAGVVGANGHGDGRGRHNGHGGSGDNLPPQPPRRRRSYWPLLVDLGLVMVLFGLIITGRPLIAVGAVIFVVALIGWIREARADFSSLRD